MNTRQYYYLSTIANYGNLSHAAQALHISPSALSKFLAECERTFGFALFLRYNRRLYPTAVGRYVVECAQKILDEQNRMLLTVKEVTGGNRKAIRLATAPNRGAIIFSKIYNQFSRRYPDISLSLAELYAAEQPGAIARGLVDLALGAGATSSEVTDIPIAHEELLVSLPASHPLAKQETIHLADLRDTPFVLQGPRHSIRLIAEQLFQQAGFQPVVAFESNDVILLDSMMHQAVGVGLVSNAHVFPCSELAYRPLDPPVHQTLHLRFPLGHTLTEPERYLAGLLITERLHDPRYKPTDAPLVDQLLQEVLSPSQLADTGSLPREAVGTALQTMQEVNLDSRVMEYLISIVEEQSLSRAAERHFLAQSALSRHLRAVEEMVGTPLFAEALRDHALPAFCARHPDIQLTIREENREQTLESLMNSSTDLGIFLSSQPRQDLLHCQVLTLTEMVYCFAPCRCPEGWQPGDLFPGGLDPRPQLMAPAGSTLRTLQDALLPQMFGQLPPAACEADTSILRQLANLGIADSLLPLNLMERRHHPRCAALAPPQPLYLLLAHHVGRTLPPVTGELMELIRTSLTDVLALP